MQRLSNPFPFWRDASGAAMDGGYLYVGVVDGNPETDPLDLFWDADLTIPALQPLRTIGGYIINPTTFAPATPFMDEDDFSIRVEDSNHSQVFYSPSVYVDTDAFQPQSATLDALSPLSTTTFGRNLLTLANSAALATQTGIPAPLPAVGGTITGNIIRSGAGAHLYNVDSGMTSGRVFKAATGDPDPTSLPGDWVFYY